MLANRRAQSWGVCVWTDPLTIGHDYRKRVRDVWKSVHRVNRHFCLSHFWKEALENVRNEINRTNCEIGFVEIRAFKVNTIFTLYTVKGYSCDGQIFIRHGHVNDICGQSWAGQFTRKHLTIVLVGWLAYELGHFVRYWKKNPTRFKNATTLL